MAEKIEILNLKIERIGVLELKSSNAMTSAERASDILKEFIGNSDREHFVVILLDIKNRINAIHTVSTGTLNTSLVHPREVFKLAILHNSASIILGHNHPSGDITPSSEDIQTTKRLIEASNIIGIKILDHIIVSDNDNFCSFTERGLI